MSAGLFGAVGATIDVGGFNGESGMCLGLWRFVLTFHGTNPTPLDPSFGP